MLLEGTCFGQDTLSSRPTILKFDIFGPPATFFMPSLRASVEVERRLIRSPRLSIVLDAEYRYYLHDYEDIYVWPQGWSEPISFYVTQQNISIFFGLRYARPFSMKSHQRLQWFLEPRLGFGRHHARISAGHTSIPNSYEKRWVIDPRVKTGIIFPIGQRITLEGSFDFLSYQYLGKYRRGLQTIGELNFGFTF